MKKTKSVFLFVSASSFCCTCHSEDETARMEVLGMHVSIGHTIILGVCAGTCDSAVLDISLGAFACSNTALSGKDDRISS